MKTQNLISVYQGANAIEAEHPNDSKDIKILKRLRFEIYTHCVIS